MQNDLLSDTESHAATPIDQTSDDEGRKEGEERKVVIVAVVAEEEGEKMREKKNEREGKNKRKPSWGLIYTIYTESQRHLNELLNSFHF